jgi:hypothetical protein
VLGDGDHATSATEGDGVVELARTIRRRLVHDDDLTFDGRWAFDPRLRRDA